MNTSSIDISITIWTTWNALILMKDSIIAIANSINRLRTWRAIFVTDSSCSQSPFSTLLAFVIFTFQTVGSTNIITQSINRNYILMNTSWTLAGSWTYFTVTITFSTSLSWIVMKILFWAFLNASFFILEVSRFAFITIEMIDRASNARFITICTMMINLQCIWRTGCNALSFVGKLIILAWSTESCWVFAWRALAWTLLATISCKVASWWAWANAFSIN